MTRLRSTAPLMRALSPFIGRVARRLASPRRPGYYPAAMAGYAIPQVHKPPRTGKKQVLLVASGDLRLSANQKCWAEQAKMEEALTRAIADEGYELMRAHPYKQEEGHGFIASQKEGMEVFRGVDPNAPLIVAEAVWQYSHHVLHGLISH